MIMPFIPLEDGNPGFLRIWRKVYARRNPMPIFTNFPVFSRVHATLHPALSVGRLVGRSVGWSHFTFFITFTSLSHF